MTCQDYQHQIILYFYEELPDSERTKLDAHLGECGACKQQFEEQQGLHNLLGEHRPSWEIPSDLLVESRRLLANELDRLEQRRPWWRIPAFSVVLTPMRMLESTALVAMGLAVGVYVSSQRVAAPAPDSGPGVISTIPQNATIEGLRVATVDSSTGHVTLVGEVVQPLELNGNMDNETVRNLTLSALVGAANPSSRLRAAEALAHNPDDQLVIDALIHALVNDENPAVRQKAAEGLTPFADQEKVSSAFIHALKNDRVEAIRIQAVEALGARFPKDDAIVRTVQEVTKDDDNPYVRMKFLQLVGDRR